MIDDLKEEMVRKSAEITLRKVDRFFMFFRFSIHASIVSGNQTYTKIVKDPRKESGMSSSIHIGVGTILDMMDQDSSISVREAVLYLLSHEIGHLSIAIESQLKRNFNSKDESEARKRNIAEDLEINWKISLPKSVGIHASDYGFKEEMNWEYYIEKLEDEENDSKNKSTDVDLGSSQNCGLTKKSKEILQDMPDKLLKIALSPVKDNEKTFRDMLEDHKISEFIKDDRQELPESWEKLIGGVKTFSRRPRTRYSYDLEQTYSRVSNRRSDSDNLILPGDKIVDSGSSPDMGEPPVLFMDISASMSGSETLIEGVSRLCKKFDINIAYYNSDLVLIDSEKFNLGETPKPNGGTIFGRALRSYINRFKYTPDKVFVITDGQDSSLSRSLDKLKGESEAWYISGNMEPKRIYPN